jgi:hypothetical protein
MSRPSVWRSPLWRWALAGTNDPDASSPVLTPPTSWNAYPLAAVSGVLELNHGCPVLEGSIAVWPHGTSWDRDQRAVTFAAPFETAPAVPDGRRFRGAGGFYEQKDLD